MPILINKTYSVVTEESAEYGDYAEQGFEFENSPYEFRELVRLLRDYSESSVYPLTDADINETVWFTSEPDIDFRTGEETTYSVHFSRDNPARNAKYWLKAARAAGLVRSKGMRHG